MVGQVYFYVVSLVQFAPSVYSLHLLSLSLSLSLWDVCGWISISIPPTLPLRLTLTPPFKDPLKPNLCACECVLVCGRKRKCGRIYLFGDQPFSHAVSTPTFIVEQVLPSLTLYSYYLKTMDEMIFHLNIWHSCCGLG